MKIAFIHLTKGIINRGSEISTDSIAQVLAQKNKVIIFQGGKPIEGKNFQQIRISLPFSINCDKPKTIFGKVWERLYLDANNLKILFFSIKTLGFLLKEQFDILIPTNGFWQVIICRIARLFKKSKIVIFGRAGIGWHDRDNINLNPDLFISLTKTAEKWAKNINNKINICYIPNGIDTQFFNAKSKPILRKNMPIILSVAALTKYKRIDLVIRAVKQMSTKCFLLIVGQGEMKLELEKLGKKLLDKNFSITDYPAKIMPQVYSSCNVFTLASDFQDAFPRVLLEALACGRNIVASDSPIKREIIDGAGILVNPQDEIAYARALEEALQVDNRQKALIRAKHYDLKRIGSLLEKTLLEIIKK